MTFRYDTRPHGTERMMIEAVTCCKGVAEDRNRRRSIGTPRFYHVEPNTRHEGGGYSGWPASVSTGQSRHEQIARQRGSPPAFIQSGNWHIDATKNRQTLVRACATPARRGLLPISCAHCCARFPKMTCIAETSGEGAMLYHTP